MMSVGGGPSNPVTAPATGIVRVDFNHQSGNTRYYDTEMLQLNISGGGLPPGVVVRESPTQQSLGQTTITDIGSGQFQIYSFFDIFTELSADGGNTWVPDANGPMHQDLIPNVPLHSSTSVPTLPQWGLILLGFVLLSLGALYIYRTR